MNSVLMRFMSDSAIKKTSLFSSLPATCPFGIFGRLFLFRLPEPFVRASGPDSLPVFPSRFLCPVFSFPVCIPPFFPLPLQCGGEARVRPPPFLFLPFPRPSGLPGGSGVPLRVFHPALPAFRVRPFCVSGGPLLRCLPVSSPSPPGMAPCAV